MIAGLVGSTLEVRQDDALGKHLRGHLRRDRCAGAMQQGDAGQPPLPRRKAANHSNTAQVDRV